MKPEYLKTLFSDTLFIHSQVELKFCSYRIRILRVHGHLEARSKFKLSFKYTYCRIFFVCLNFSDYFRIKSMVFEVFRDIAYKIHTFHKTKIRHANWFLYVATRSTLYTEAKLRTCAIQKKLS